MSTFRYDIFQRCAILPLNEELAALPFECGDSEMAHDLEDFFHHQAMMYAKERL